MPFNGAFQKKEQESLQGYPAFISNNSSRNNYNDGDCDINVCGTQLPLFHNKLHSKSCTTPAGSDDNDGESSFLILRHDGTFTVNNVSLPTC